MERLKKFTRSLYGQERHRVSIAATTGEQRPRCCCPPVLL